MRKRLFGALALAIGTAALVSPLQGQEQAPAPAPAAAEPAPDIVDYASDRTERMTVAVSIGARGPFRFVVDTGAERTVISRELADDLQLGKGRGARMHSMTEVSNVSTFLIPELMVGRKRVSDVHAPALEGRNLGAEGMLGVDTLQSQRVLFDFANQKMTITPSRRSEARWPSDTIVVTARSRFGHLVLVDASIEGERVYAIVDTGSQVTIGNSALRRKLERKGRLGVMRPIGLLSVTGGTMAADQTVVKSMTLGGGEIMDMPIAFADVHPFAKLKLTDRPAILLGMDALQLFDRVSVDFANRRVRLMRPGRSDLHGLTRMAHRQPQRRAHGG